MEPHLKRLVMLVAVLAAAAVCCKPEREPLVEVGRWVDDSMPAVFIFYHMREDIPEAELKELLKPNSRQLAVNYGFVIQAAVHDEAWAKKLATAETRQRVMDNELLIGTDLVIDESMTVQGGLVYTYYKDGDYDEYIYYERSEAR